MPKQSRELKALEVKKLTKPGRHAVGGTPAGLYLNITETGTRSWVFRIVIGTNRRHIGLGSYPEVTLGQARELALAEKQQIKAGVDPVEKRRAARVQRAAEQRLQVTFAEAFEKVYEDKVQGEHRNAKHIKQWRSTMESYAFPVMKDMPVSEIDIETVLAVLRPIWADKVETAKRVRQRIEAVLDWAKAMGHLEGENPARWKGNLQQILPSPNKIKNEQSHPAVALDELARWFSLTREREGISALALEFLTLTAARSGEVRQADWSEVDMNFALWTIPAERMKAGREHRVPLSKAAIALLQRTPRMMGCSLVFPSSKSKPLSDMSISAVMRRMQEQEVAQGRLGFLDQRSRKPAVPHGLRSSFCDWAAERTDYPKEMAEMALAHTVGSEVERAYRRTDMLERRRAMMEDWAAFLQRTS
ncbi:integrase [Salipiger pallidus]|uniref:Integrase n=1 Tax=Salipiger pallidus TaxID=1775170 RepID=A0A8J3EEQ7_9RHOB|nr:integrase arm-type DNA-binding domain-containing protein [Salipiger pallidus]GGG65493.1 integrase [Salipiger pallidus]